MKYLFIFLLLFFSPGAFAQYPANIDSIYFTERKTEWKEVADFTNGIINDSIFGIVFNGKKYQRVDLNTTSFNAQSLMVKADGTDMSARLNRLFSNSRINEIVIDQQTGPDIGISDDIDLKDKTLKFTGFTRLKRLSGNPAIKNGTISAPMYARIADTLINFFNIQTGDGNFYPQWVGAKADGVTNDMRYWQKAADVAVANKLQFVIPSGISYINGTFTFKTNGTLIGNEGSRIVAGTSTQFTYDGGCDNVKIGNINIKINPGAGSKNLFHLGDASVSSNSLVFENNVINARRKGGTTVGVKNTSDVIIRHNIIDSSCNKGIAIVDVNRADISFNRVRNSGRAGIAVEHGVRNATIHHNWASGSGQNTKFTDGVYDIYGPNNEYISFENNYAETGELNADGISRNHILYRFQGFKHLVFKNNVGVSTSNYLLYAVRFANRDSYMSSDVDASGNEIYIKGYYDKVINFQGVWDAQYTNYKIRIDSSASGPGSYIFYVQNEPRVDMVRNLSLTGGTVTLSGKKSYLFGYLTDIKSVDFSGTVFTGNRQNLYTQNSRKTIQRFKWVGGKINSAISPGGRIITINNNLRSVQISGLNIEKAGNLFWSIIPGYTGDAIIRGNIINGTIAPEVGGDK